MMMVRTFSVIRYNLRPDAPEYWKIIPGVGSVARISRRQFSAGSISEWIAVHANLLFRKISARCRLVYEWIVPGCVED